MNKTSDSTYIIDSEIEAALQKFPIAEGAFSPARGPGGGGGNNNDGAPKPPEQVAVPTSKLRFGSNVVIDQAKNLVGLHVVAGVTWAGVIEPENLKNYVTRWRVWCNQPQPQWVDALHHGWQHGDGDFSPYLHLATGGPSNVQPPPGSIIWVSPRTSGTVDFVLEIYHTMGSWYREANFQPSGSMPAGVYLYKPQHAPHRSLAVLRAAIPK